MKRRILAALMAITMLFTMIPGAFAEEVTVETTPEIVELASPTSEPEPVKEPEPQPEPEPEPETTTAPVEEAEPNSPAQEAPSTEAGSSDTAADNSAADADKAVAQTVVGLIDAIGEVTTGSEAAINAAYNALTDAQKKHVGNYDVLVSALAKYMEISTPAAPETSYPVTGNCGKELTWTLSADGKLTILGKDEMDNYVMENSQP